MDTAGNGMPTHPRLPPLNTLRAFWAVMRCGNLRDAAGDLLVTPQAVGHQMKILERTLQVTLFDRTQNTLMPTEQAVLLFHFVKSGFGQFDQGLTTISELTHGDQSPGFLPNASPHQTH